MPKMAAASSLRPAPTNPDMPTISPDRTSKEISFNTFSRLRLRTDSTTSPIGLVSATVSRTSRPTIMRMTLSWSSSEMGRVPTSLPSRSTVTRSATRKTSSSQCETKTMPSPLAFKSFTTAKRRSISGGESDVVGSSMTSTFESSEIARAISTSCWSAGDRRPAGVDGLRCGATRASASSARCFCLLTETRP